MEATPMERVEMLRNDVRTVFNRLSSGNIMRADVPALRKELKFKQQSLRVAERDAGLR